MEEMKRHFTSGLEEVHLGMTLLDFKKSLSQLDLNWISGIRSFAEYMEYQGLNLDKMIRNILNNAKTSEDVRLIAEDLRLIAVTVAICGTKITKIIDKSTDEFGKLLSGAMSRLGIPKNNKKLKPHTCTMSRVALFLPHVCCAVTADMKICPVKSEVVQTLPWVMRNVAFSAMIPKHGTYRQPLQERAFTYIVEFDKLINSQSQPTKSEVMMGYQNAFIDSEYWPDTTKIGWLKQFGLITPDGGLSLSDGPDDGGAGGGSGKKDQPKDDQGKGDSKPSEKKDSPKEDNDTIKRGDLNIKEVADRLMLATTSGMSKTSDNMSLSSTLSSPSFVASLCL